MNKYLLVVLMTLTNLSATVLNVPGDYATIQAGINASVEGDTVLVAQGNYVENLILEKENDLVISFFQTKKSPRNLAIAFQNKIKKKGDSWPQSNKSRP